MRFNRRTLMLILFSLSLFLTGCSTTLQEKKSTETDPGNSTQLKFTGSKLKVVHNF